MEFGENALTQAQHMFIAVMPYQILIWIDVGFYTQPLNQFAPITRFCIICKSFYHLWALFLVLIVRVIRHFWHVLEWL